MYTFNTSKGLFRWTGAKICRRMPAYEIKSSYVGIRCAYVVVWQRHKRDFRALPADGAIMKNAKMSSVENRVCVGLFKFKINYLNRRLVRRQVSRRLIWINRPSNKMYVTCAHMSDPVKPLSYRSRPQSHVQTIRVRMRHWVTRRSTRIQAVWHSDNIFTKFEGLWSTLVICIRRQT